MPIYLPLKTDVEEGGQKVFMGGLNFYLSEKVKAFRILPSIIKKWLDHPKFLKSLSRLTGMTKAEQLGQMTYAMLRGESEYQNAECKKIMDHITSIMGAVDCIILSNALLVGLAPGFKKVSSATIVCTLQGEDGFLDSLPDHHKERCWKQLNDSARHIDGWIAVSEYYRQAMLQRMKVDPSLVHVVHNGVRVPEPGSASSSRQPTIGYLARMCRDKGLDQLMDAFITLKQDEEMKNVKCIVAGAMLHQDITFVNEIKTKLKRSGLISDVDFKPNVTAGEKEEFFKSIDLFSVPASYGEAFGLYVIEALSYGVPVVQPDSGAFAEILNITNGGVIFKMEEPGAYLKVIKKCLRDLNSCREMGQRGRESVKKLFNLERMASEVVQKIFQIKEAKALS